MPCRHSPCWPLSALLIVLSVILLTVHAGAGSSARPSSNATTTTGGFPSELVNFVPLADNPVFTAGGPGAWDARIRERGWILRDQDGYHLWYTGYDGTPHGVRQLGYATSHDGLRWTRWPGNPLCAGHWVEDMMVVKQADTYYMFAEGLHDEAQLLTSKDRVHWQRAGRLDIRTRDGRPLSPGPFGTPTAWREGDTWYLFYERRDAGVWLATSRDFAVWTNLQDEPVMVPGPARYDNSMIALNQVIKYRGQYFAFYHGTGNAQPGRAWNTDVARSDDLVHWRKYEGNPIVAGNKSSGIVVFDGRRLRLYTMHDQVEVFFPRDE